MSQEKIFLGISWSNDLSLARWKGGQGRNQVMRAVYCHYLCLSTLDFFLGIYTLCKYRDFS